MGGGCTRPGGAGGKGGEGGRGGSCKEQHQVVAKLNGFHRSVDNVLVVPVGDPDVEC